MPLLFTFPACFTRRPITPPDITDPFTAADGALDATRPTDHAGSGAYTWTAANWTITSNNAAPNPTETANLAADADLESASVPGSWVTNGASLNERSTEQKHAGTYARKITAGAAQGVYQNVSSGITTQSWAKMKAWLYVSAGKAMLGVGGINYSTDATAAGWNQRTVTGRYRNPGAIAFQVYGNQAASTWYLDDAEIYGLTHGDLFATVDTGRADKWSISAAATFEKGQPCGLVACLDSASSPSSYVVMWHNTTALVIEKLVAGTRTLLANISTGVAYHATDRFGMSRNGDTWKFYYNGQLASTQTITDAQIVSNTRHGLFSTIPASVLHDFRFRPQRARVVSVLGDSISAGHLTETADWTYQLTHDAALGCVDLKNHAVNAQTVLSHMDAQTTASASDGADVIIVLLGINDTTDTGFQAEYTENLQELAASNAGAAIYALGLLPLSSGHAFYARRALYNPLISAAAATAGVTYVNTDGWIDPATDTSDGLHPTAGGAVKILNEIKARVSL